MTINHLINMGGYEFYVWTAYGIVISSLSYFFFVPLKNWRNYLKQQKTQ